MCYKFVMVDYLCIIFVSHLKKTLCSLQTLPAMQRQVQVLEEKYKDIAQLKTMKEQVEELKKERVWAEVIATEKVQALYR